MSVKFISPWRLYFALVLVACFASVDFTDNGQASEVIGEKPKFFSADLETLATSKSALAAGDATLPPALNRLLAAADQRLEQTPPSLIDKMQTTPTGDKHCYIKQAP